MKKSLFFTFSLFCSLMLSAQNDPQAMRILDDFSARATKAPSVSMEFTMITSDLAENTADSVQGSLLLKKDNYKLALGENQVWFDGETTWNFLEAENEVTITKPDKKDHSFQNHPSDIFTMYKSGFKSRLVEENSSAYTVDLYPTDIKSDLVRVRLNIRKTDLTLLDFEYKRRDGVVINIRIGKFDLEHKADPSEFVFPAARFKGVEINDMR